MKVSSILEKTDGYIFLEYQKAFDTVNYRRLAVKLDVKLGSEEVYSNGLKAT